MFQEKKYLELEDAASKNLDRNPQDKVAMLFLAQALYHTERNKETQKVLNNLYTAL